MAQLDDKTLQNLNKRLKEMDEILASDYRKALDLGKAFTQGFSTEQIDAFLRKLGKINRADAAKLNVMFNLVDVNGKPITVQEAKYRIEQLKGAIERGQASTKIRGTSIVGLGSMTNELKRYKDALSILGMSTSQQFDLISRNVKRVNNEVKGLRKGFGDMIPTLQRLASAFGVAFSVRGLAQFGKKLIETRGEFEMQFVAMKQIIGDVDAATKIWNQTMQQALQSPKTFKELVTYTKQLAAYRIETEKLFDTTKRLADVSAGLGVEMSRLILAYGQVKSANFLRASEVRQFTEAGVNIVGNLAQYFTELESRAVGTSEVMERITKRMVLFSDVEAIFKRMTDEGGEFFNMQEVQADTVKGQIQKLHDAYDQMLNTIGQANQGTIRNFVDTLNNLVRNWQNVAFVLKANINWITIFGASLYALSNKYMKGATTQTLWFGKALLGNDKVLLKNVADVRIFGKVLGDFTLKQRVAIVATRTFQSALSAVGNVMKTLWPLLVFEGITLLIERLTRANRELKRFREELQEVASTDVGQMDEEINGYDTLIKKLKQTTEGTMARKEVLDEISRRYGKYLDFIITETTSVEQLAGAYDKVVSSIRNYTAEKIREEQQQKLEKGLYDEYQDLIKDLTGARVDIGDKTRKLSSEQAKRIAKIIQQELEKSGVLSAKDVQDILSTYFGETVYATLGGANTNILGYVGNYQDAFSSLKKELQEIRDDIEGVTPVFSSEAEYEQYKKNVEAAKKEIAYQNDLYQQQVDLVKQKTEEQWKLDDEIAKLRLENEEEILRIRKEYGLISEGQYNDELARLHGRLDTYETDYNKRLAKALAESYGESWQTEKKEARDMYNYVVSTEQALAQGTTQRNKQLKESYKGFKDSLEQYNAQFEAAVNSGASKESLDKIQADIDLAKLLMAAIELAAQLRGIDLSEKKTKTRTTHENASKLISLIKEMRSEYDKLSKSAYGYAKSEEKVRESYAQSVEKILGKAGVTKEYDFTTNEGMIAALDKVLAYANKLGPEAAAEVQKYIDQLETEIEINAQVRIREDFGKQMEEAFNNYELTLDIEKLNLPSDVLADMFDIESVDLAGLRKKIEEGYERLRGENGGNIDETDRKNIEGYIKKIDDMERKQQRERIKDYAKYLEYEMSERAKITMEYVRKISDVQAETSFSSKQKDRIVKGLTKEMNEKLAKQDWDDFKGSEVYVQMMEDLEKHGSAALVTMRKELEKIRDNAENLSPRALKEVVNALAKIKEIELNRSNPFTALNQSRVDMQNAISKANAKSREEVYAEADAIEKEIVAEQGRKREIDNIVSARKEGLRIEEELSKLYSRHNILDYSVTSTDKDDFVQSNINALQASIKANVSEIENLQTERAKEGTTEERVRRIDDEIGSIIEETNQYREQKEILEKILQLRISLGLIDKNAIQDEDAEQRQAESETKLENLAEEQRRYQEAVDAIDRYNAQVQRAMQFVDEWAGKVQGLWGEISNLSTAYEGEFGDWVAKWGNVIDVSLSQVSKLSKAFADFRKTRADYLKSAVKKTTDKVSNAAETAQTATTTLATNAETEAITANTLAKTENAVASNLAATGNTAVGTTATAATPAVATFGATLLMAMGWVGLIIAALEALFVIIKAIAGANDEGIDQKIEDSKDKVDKLTKAYERLEKQIEKTWDTVSYMREYNEEVQNLQQQIEEANNQIAAAQDYKSEDKKREAIEAAEDAKQEALDALDEIKQKQIEVFGGIGEEGYRDAAQGFVDAWKSAFLETGDGLQGLQDHFDEFLNDWFVKQATMRVAGRMLEPLFRQIDSAVDQYDSGGTNVLMQELQNVREKFGVLAPQLSEALEELAGMWGLGSEGSLSGLAAGIQGMTEEQANILEAYWNSVRGYTANIDMNVSRIAQILGAGGDSTNPQLQQLTLIAANTQATHQLLQSVTKSGHSQGGYGIKVFAD